MPIFKRFTSKPNRKQLTGYIYELETYIREQMVSNDDLTRVYAVMRIAVRDTLGQEALNKVLGAVGEINEVPPELMDEFLVLFPNDVQKVKLKKVD